MIKLSRRPSTTYLQASYPRWPTIIKWGQEFPRALLASGNLASGDASGNEFEEITIRTESQPLACEIILRWNRASEANQRDYPGNYVGTAAIRGVNENIRVLSSRKKNDFLVLIAIRHGYRLGDPQ